MENTTYKIPFIILKVQINTKSAAGRRSQNLRIFMSGMPLGQTFYELRAIYKSTY